MLAVFAHEALLKMGFDETAKDEQFTNDTEKVGAVTINRHSVQLNPPGTVAPQSIEAQASVTFSLSKTEYIEGSNLLIAHGDYKNQQNPCNGNNVKWLNRVALVLIPISAFALAIVCKTPVWAALLFGMLAFLPTVVLSLRAQLLTDKLRDYDHDGPLLDSRTIAANQNGLFITNRFGYNYYQWDRVKKIIDSPDYILIIIDMFYAHTIPNRIFADEAQKKSLLNLLDAYSTSESNTQNEFS